MTAATLRADAAALANHARRCDDVADRLAQRTTALRGLLDLAVQLHVESTWDSPTASERREALRSRRDELEALRGDLTSLVDRLRARAVVDRADARMLCGLADQLDEAARLAAMETHGSLPVGPR
jgi:acyl-CoA reductase-like NAD-dependent aldehyde dehydrogenase